MSDKRFRIAFSFAGEKRDFVAKVAALLAATFDEDSILYDKYHEAEFSRARLGRYLPKLYHDETQLIVVVICQDYSSKEWPGLEWDAIFDLLKRRKEEDVMLCRFDHAAVEGLFSDAGYVELDERTPWKTAELILQRLALNEGKDKKTYVLVSNDDSVPPRTSIPNNLPRLQSFFGRAEELKKIADALAPGTRTWGVIIVGLGGMGKTSLAVRAAYECTSDQFDRIIFLSVKDRELDDDGDRQLGAFILPGFLEMLNELARELDKPEINKATESERIRLLLDALKSTRVLLILDNLETLTKSDRGRLLTFVRHLPQGCNAILTSRDRIGSVSELLILEQLDEQAALETLDDLARHNPLLGKVSKADRFKVYEQTGGKPLLLRWTAGQLGLGSCRKIDEALAFLRSCPPGNDPLEFVFGYLADEFTPEETITLAALTYFTLPAKVEHIAEMARLDLGTVQTVFRIMANRSLVVPDQEERAFVLVPMVADFVRRKRPEVITETGDRLEQRAYTLIVENAYEKHDSFPLLDALWPTVAPALPLFVTGSNDRLQTVCEALYQFFYFTGRWDEALSLFQQAEARAVATGDHDNAGWRAYQAGWVHSLREQADHVLASADRAAGHWSLAQAGARERAFAIRLRGVGHELKKDYAAAITAFGEAFDLHCTISAESKDGANTLNDLARVEHVSGNLAAAERDYREALRVACAVGYAEGVAFVTGNLANLALDREDWLGAETLARESLTLSEKLCRQELIASHRHRLAKALVRQGKGNEALPYAQRAVEIYTRLGSPRLKIALEILSECEESSKP